MTDQINPLHYKSDTIECIDAMKACSTPEEFRGHLKLTVLKYLWREDKKGKGDQARVENLEKAAWYLERLIGDLRGDVTGLIDFATPETIPSHTINAADQGWIEWTGAKIPPVLNHCLVDVEIRSGRIDTAREAGDLWWDCRSLPGDIIRWRPSK